MTVADHVERCGDLALVGLKELTPSTLKTHSVQEVVNI
jgi:hypothetical protein